MDASRPELAQSVKVTGIPNRQASGLEPKYCNELLGSPERLW